ncbi:MAG: DUF3634 family protein [Myxococcota bacterium]
MHDWVFPLLFAVLALAAGVALRRAGELFVVAVRGGRVVLVRGRIPSRLLDDLGDVLRGADDMTLRARVVDDRAKLTPAGGRGRLSPATAQRLRNVISLWPVAKIRNAPRRRGRARRARPPART